MFSYGVSSWDPHDPHRVSSWNPYDLYGVSSWDLCDPQGVSRWDPRDLLSSPLSIEIINCLVTHSNGNLPNSATNQVVLVARPVDSAVLWVVVS